MTDFANKIYWNVMGSLLGTVGSLTYGSAFLDSHKDLSDIIIYGTPTTVFGLMTAYTTFSALDNAYKLLKK